MMNDAKTLFDGCRLQESTLTFDRFSREDALQIGLLLHKNAQKFTEPVAIEITLNGLTVFRFFPEGTIPDNEKWLARKRNTVQLMCMSSLRAMAHFELTGESLTDRKLNPNDYATCGGGFPISLKGTGVVGSICVSGLPHLDDHQLIVDTLTEYLHCK